MVSMRHGMRYCYISRLALSVGGCSGSEIRVQRLEELELVVFFMPVASGSCGCRQATHQDHRFCTRHIRCSGTC